MPPFPYRKHHREPEPEPSLVITVKYEGLKATQFFAKYTEDAYRQLKSDLTVLGVPHPKKINIHFISHGILDLVYPASYMKQTAFSQNIKFRVELPNDSPHRQELLELRQQLSIVNMTTRRVARYNPYSSILDTLYPPVTTPPLHSKTQQVNQHNVKKSGTVRVHPYQRPATQDVDTQRQMSKGTGGKSASSSRLQTSGQPTAIEHATQLSNRVGGPPNAAMHPSPEKTKSTTSVAQPTNFITPVARRLQPIMPSIEPVAPATPGTTIAAIDPTVPLTSTTPVKQERMSPAISTNSLPSSIIPLQNGHNPYVPLRSTHLGQPIDEASSTSPIPGLTMRLTESARIRKLKTELSAVRNDIISKVAEEASIVKELQSLNVSDIPPFSVCNHTMVDPLQKARFQEMEKELESERNKRLELEAVLQDIERESKEPFVVPALLEAFIKISKVSTVAIQRARSSQDA